LTREINHQLSQNNDSPEPKYDDVAYASVISAEQKAFIGSDISVSAQRMNGRNHSSVIQTQIDLEQSQ